MAFRRTVVYVWYDGQMLAAMGRKGLPVKQADVSLLDKLYENRESEWRRAARVEALREGKRMDECISLMDMAGCTDLLFRLIGNTIRECVCSLA